ncbi:hypothetical protein BD779DRAFT_1465304 [Infundibulicybe gibba]|nr:hypothetical protein BD779DRAFT_1465304 [Infundibulicybe gibba]
MYGPGLVLLEGRADHNMSPPESPDARAPPLRHLDAAPSVVHSGRGAAVWVGIHPMRHHGIMTSQAPSQASPSYCLHPSSPQVQGSHEDRQSLLCVALALSLGGRYLSPEAAQPEPDPTRPPENTSTRASARTSSGTSWQPRTTAQKAQNNGIRLPLKKAGFKWNAVRASERCSYVVFVSVSVFASSNCVMGVVKWFVAMRRGVYATWRKCVRNTPGGMRQPAYRSTHNG